MWSENQKNGLSHTSKESVYEHTLDLFDPSCGGNHFNYKFYIRMTEV